MGGISDGGPSSPAPDGGSVPTAKAGKTLYTSTVHGAVTTRCAGGACHAQPGVAGVYGFALADAGAAYDELVKVPTLVGTFTPTSAAFWTKIESGAHQGITLSADDKAKVTAWLAQEVTDRMGDMTQPPPVDPVAKLRQWSGCMSLDNFTTAGMPQAWGQLAADNLQRCANCHGSGAFSFMSGSGDAEPFFQTITTQKDLLLKYFTVGADGKVAINTASFRNAGVVIENHPRFNATTNAGMTALGAFYDATLAREAAGQCDPPRLP